MTTKAMAEADEELARELHDEVHGNLEHAKWVRDGHFDIPYVHRAWVVVAQVYREGKVLPGRWLDEYAHALFTEVHVRLGDALCVHRDAFWSIPGRHEAWLEIARVFERRWHEDAVAAGRLTTEGVRGKVDEVRAAAAKSDYKVAHALEDALHVAVLRAVADGLADEPASCAREALAACEINFRRACA